MRAKLYCSEARRRHFADVAVPIRRWMRRQSCFQFFDQWCVGGTLEEVATLLLDVSCMGGWWPQCSEIHILHPGDELGGGCRVASTFKGLLPHPLRIEYQITQVHFPIMILANLSGDLTGNGRATLQQNGSEVKIDFEMHVLARRPLYRLLSMMCKPVLRAHHDWTQRSYRIAYMLCFLRKLFENRVTSSAYLALALHTRRYSP